MNNNLKILLIIPAYNEQDNILQTVGKIYEFNAQRQKEGQQTYDVLVVNDGSADNTEKILRDNNIPHLHLKQNLGIGGAVQAGYKYALYNNYDVAIQYDGDGQHDVTCVDSVVAPLATGQADMVIGSRFVDETSSDFKSSATRRAGINLLSFFIKLFTGTRILDTTSGFRAANKTTIAQFAWSYPHEYPEPVTTTRLLKQGKKIKEVPVSMNERTAGTSSITTLKSIYFMINVCFSIIVEGIGGYKNES